MCTTHTHTQKQILDQSTIVIHYDICTWYEFVFCFPVYRNFNFFVVFFELFIKNRKMKERLTQLILFIQNIHHHHHHHHDDHDNLKTIFNENNDNDDSFLSITGL